ncbi:calmodulin-binding transcription activator 1-like [Vicia villosa]|uniref:calmodulin-binding transcription activator 1-like n=1 Tax=Vicia villosa TaxID=3911 RepID=UPI00273B016F|nr:calmodulin-binding transcription activator 1-like [Vicia villosa]
MALNNNRYLQPNQFDIQQILSEAQYRWLRPAEICQILTNHNHFQITSEPANMPPSGSLFLFDRKVMRYFRKDGHNWRKKKDGKTVREAHERLKAGSVEVLHCYYAHGEQNQNFQRRTYWMLEDELSHIVLVHYREVKGNKETLICSKENEESNPHYAQQTYKAMPNTEMETSLPSSMNSAQPSDYEEAESAFNSHANSDFHSFLEMQHPVVQKIKAQQLADFNCPLPLKDGLERLPVINNVGLTCEPSKLLGFSSWQDILENNAGSHNVPFQHFFPETQFNDMGINSTSQGYEVMGQHLSIGITNHHENGSLIEDKGNWQDSGFNSLSTSSWPKDNVCSGSTCEVSYRNNEQEVNKVDFRQSLERFLLHPHQQHKVMQDSSQRVLLQAESNLKSDLEVDRSVDGIQDICFTSKKSLLHASVAEDGLKKLDSFNRWMSKELGDVKESSKQSTSSAYWDTIESENGIDSITIPSQVHLDNYVLDPSICYDQLFTIIDYSPSWTFEDSETKVLISGRFLRSQHEAEDYKWSCMFGEVEVPAEIIGNGVLCCHTPPHKAGRVPFYVTCSNRLACSEVREFDFRVNCTQEANTAGENRSGNTLDTFNKRFGELLSQDQEIPQSLDSISVNEKSQLRSKISSLFRREDDEWEKILKYTLEKDFSPELVQEKLFQNLLKDKLNSWLLQKTTEDGKGPNVLDEGGQGVLHFAAALGYDWALEPTIVAGVNVNFRDVNGWTALHWAAFCGRERTVASLISLGAAPGALTDPCPQHPSGRTPADLASANGHKGIAGYLAESFLSAQLKSIDLKREAGESFGSKIVQRVHEQNTFQLNNERISHELSMKDSLAAVCNATQAAARIHQVFRVQSFQRKQQKEHGVDKFGMSDERALSLIAANAKSHKFGQRDEPVHVAATRIQNKFRSWKGRKDFLIIRQRIVKIQAHVRGHQVRKNYGKIIWSVGIVEKIILRWRRKGSGLRGFKSEAISEGAMVQDASSSTEDDYDFLKEGRKQTEKRLEKALARVKSMAQYPDARDQYHRLLNVVTDIQENQVKQDSSFSNSEETRQRQFNNLVDLEALLDEDTFMSTDT